MLSYCLDFGETLHFRFTFVALVLLTGKMCGVLVSLSRKIITIQFKHVPRHALFTRKDLLLHYYKNLTKS